MGHQCHNNDPQAVLCQVCGGDIFDLRVRSTKLLSELEAWIQADDLIAPEYIVRQMDALKAALKN